MKTHYKNEGIMKALTVIGGVVGLLTIILRLTGNDYGYININLGLDAVLIFIIGLVVCVITILVGMREILTFHWLTLLILAILLAVFNAGVWAVVCLVIAFLIGLIEDL